jgi:hypothetical protein
MRPPQPSIRITESQANQDPKKALHSSRKALKKVIRASSGDRSEGPELAELSDVSAIRRLEPWAMLAAVRRLMPEHRVSSCCRIPIPRAVHGIDGVQVLHQAAPAGQPGSRARARYGNLATCGNVWVCPICAPRLARRRATLIHRALTRHVAGGGRVLLVTLTHHHGRDGHLPAQLDKQAEALAHMQRTGSFRRLCTSHGLIGTIRALELTHSRRAGWHVHLHLILFLAGNEGQAEQHAVLMQQMDAAAPNRRKDKTLPKRAPVKVAQVRRLPAFGRDYVAAWCAAAGTAGLNARLSDQRATIASCDLASLERLADYLTKATGALGSTTGQRGAAGWRT